MSNVRTFKIALRKSQKVDSFHCGASLQKSQAAPRKVVVIELRKSVPKSEKTLTPGAIVRVQHPYRHTTPVHARVLTVGEVGVQVVDENGQMYKVHHPDIIDHNPRPPAHVRAQIARHADRHGYTTSASEKYLHTDAEGNAVRKPTDDQLEMLATISKLGVPVDTEAISAHGTYDDAQEVINQFVHDPEGVLGEQTEADVLARYGDDDEWGEA